jgi:hypothetical protein
MWKWIKSSLFRLKRKLSVGGEIQWLYLLSPETGKIFDFSIRQLLTVDIRGRNFCLLGYEPVLKINPYQRKAWNSAKEIERRF